MLTVLRQSRSSALNRISLLLSLTAGDHTAASSSSYSSSSLPHDSRRNHAILAPSSVFVQPFGDRSMCSPMAVKACFSSEAEKDSADPTEIVADLYQQMLKSVEEARTMPPNAKLWSLVEHCKNLEDVKLLFQILQRLRVFRLSNLRIHANFNGHLCMRVAEACARADASDFGMKALWNHNVYGLTPSIASAHYLLLHAKEKNDVSLMAKIMQIMKKNSLPLQPGDAKSIWKIEKLRSKAVKKHTLASGFSCAKGYLIEHNPESAAAAINFLYQELPDQKKALITDELQKLVEWSKQIVKRQKKEDREGLAEDLKSQISAMASSLLSTGINVKLNLEELTY